MCGRVARGPAPSRSPLRVDRPPPLAGEDQEARAGGSPAVRGPPPPPSAPDHVRGSLSPAGGGGT